MQKLLRASTHQSSTIGDHVEYRLPASDYRTRPPNKYRGSLASFEGIAAEIKVYHQDYPIPQRRHRKVHRRGGCGVYIRLEGGMERPYKK